MKHSSMSDYDADVIPMVEYFNSVGLKTYMSCSGHKDNPYMSMFWIEFDPSVTEQDIIDFQRNHGIDTNRLYIKIEESTDGFGKEYNAIGIGAAYPEAFSPESKVIYVRKVSINTNN